MHLMTMNTQGRPTSPLRFPRGDRHHLRARGLLQAEDLIFEIGSTDKTGVDLPKPKGTKSRLGGVTRAASSGLPGLTEPEAVRHYVRLSQRTMPSTLACSRSARAR
jgi:glycine dehydrogenase subunit 2